MHEGDDPGDVELKVGREGAPASLEAPKGALNQCMASSQASVEVCLVWVKLAGVRVYEPQHQQVGRLSDEEGWNGHIAQLQAWDTNQGWQDGVLENPGVTGAARSAGADVLEGTPVVHHDLQHDQVEALLAVVGPVHLGWTGDGDRCPIKGPMYWGK